MDCRRHLHLQFRFSFVNRYGYAQLWCGYNCSNNWPYSISGTLTITSKLGNIISGNFNAVLDDTNRTISGSFTNLSIQ